MDVSDIKKQRDMLIVEINELLYKFQEETGVVVDGVILVELMKIGDDQDITLVENLELKI